jgi:hypothetical protein
MDNLLLLRQYRDGAVVAEISYPVELGGGYLGSLMPFITKSPLYHTLSRFLITPELGREDGVFLGLIHARGES